MALNIYEIKKNSKEGGVKITTTPLNGVLKAIAVKTETPIQLKIQYRDYFNQIILNEHALRDTIFFPKVMVRNSKGTFYVPETTTEYILFGGLVINYVGKPNTPIDITIIYE